MIMDHMMEATVGKAWTNVVENIIENNKKTEFALKQKNNLKTT